MRSGKVPKRGLSVQVGLYMQTCLWLPSCLAVAWAGEKGFTIFAWACPAKVEFVTMLGEHRLNKLHVTNGENGLCGRFLGLPAIVKERGGNGRCQEW
jgi:hypothetical protein